MTTTSEAATEAMQEARKKWTGLTHVFFWTGTKQRQIAEIAYEAGWRAALAWAAKERSEE